MGVKGAVNDTQTNGCGYMPIKLYLQNIVLQRCSLPTCDSGDGDEKRGRALPLAAEVGNIDIFSCFHLTNTEIASLCSRHLEELYKY